MNIAFLDRERGGPVDYPATLRLTWLSAAVAAALLIGYTPPIAAETEWPSPQITQFGKVYTCTYTVPSKANCSVSNTTWKFAVYNATKNYKKEWLSGDTFSASYLNLGLKKGNTSGAQAWFETYNPVYSGYVGYFHYGYVGGEPKSCPDAEVTFTYNCQAKTPPPPTDPCACPNGEKKQFAIQDSDGDGYVTYQGAMCPSVLATGWKITTPDKVKGFECGRKLKSTVTECGVTYALNQKDYAFPDEYIGTAWSDPNWNPESKWVQDEDKDGWYTGVQDPVYVGCLPKYPNEPSFNPEQFNTFVIKKDPLKSGDCNDKDPKINGPQLSCRDGDGDGHCCADFNNDGYCGPPVYAAKLDVCPNNPVKGYIPITPPTLQDDECDTTKEAVKKFEVCEDKDGDGFVNKATCQSTCTADAYPGLVMADPKKSNKGYDCAAGGDLEFKWNPNTQWLIDCDGDGYYPEDKVVKGCQKPKTPEICILDAQNQKTENPNANPLTEYVTNYSDPGKALKKGDCADQWFKMNAGTTWVTDVDKDGYYDVTRSIVQCEDPDKVSNQTYPQCSGSPDPQCTIKAATYEYKMLSKVDWKKGDCDDDDAEIRDLMYVFADQDNDKKGDPTYSAIIDCENKSLVSDANENFDWAPELDPQVAWAKQPNDVQIGDKAAPAFFIQSGKPTYCINQTQPQMNACIIHGSYCRYEPNAEAPDFSCLNEGLRSNYCPTLGTMTDPNLAYDFTPWYNDGKFPYGTVYPILTFEEYEELTLKPLEVNWVDSWLLAACLYHNKGGPMNFFLGWLNVEGKNDPYIFLELQPKLDDDDEIAPPSWYRLVAAFGTDYQLMWPMLAQPEYAAVWKAPSNEMIPSATIEPEQFSKYFWVLDILKVNTLEGLKKLTATLEYQPYPIPVKVTQTGSAWGAIAGNKRCVYYGQLLTENQCLGKGHGKISPDQLAQKPYLFPQVISNPADKDGDGVPDLAESSLPGLTDIQAQQAAADPNIAPVALGKSHMMLIMKNETIPASPMSVEMKQDFESAKQVAIGMLPKVMKQLHDMMEVKNLALTEDVMKALIMNASPVRMWSVTDEGLIIAPPTMTMDGKIYVNPWLVLQKSPGQLTSVTLANALLHAALHSHIVITPAAPGFEHEIISAVLSINIDKVNDVE